jgi:hypothetical protein
MKSEIGMTHFMKEWPIGIYLLNTGVKELRDLITENSLVERKAFIETSVREIPVTGNDVLMKYTVP